jgi:MFS family permease
LNIVQAFKASLWYRANFLRLWLAQTISLFGTKVTELALPTLAILVFHVSASQLSVLVALQWITFLVIGPFAGIVADRLPRRIILITMDLLRLIALASIPLCFAEGLHILAQLYVMTGLVSTCTVFFNVASQSYLPELVTSSDLLEGNARLALGDSAARVGGPGLAGLLIQGIGAASALLADALSYLCSALLLFSIRHSGIRQVDLRPRERGHVWSDIQEGFVLLTTRPLLLPIALANAITNLGIAMVEAIILLFLCTMKRRTRR